MKSVTTTSNLITERRKLENKIGEQDLRITIEKKVEKKIKMKRILFKIQMQKIFLKKICQKSYTFLLSAKSKNLKKWKEEKEEKKGSKRYVTRRKKL